MKYLGDLYKTHEGKTSDKWGLYIEEYEDILAPYRNLPISMLEIGIQNGGSLEIWSKYFPKYENIIGCDIDEKCASLNYDNKNINVIIGDANSDHVKERVFKISNTLDIVIDDGSHFSGDIVKSFFLYFPMIKDGGIFIAEDLHCSYWMQYEGGIYYPYSSISFFKKLADIVNYEHWGNEKSRSDLLKGFFARYQCSIKEEILSQVHSIEFINSICVIKKTRVEKNLLGLRIVVGDLDFVKPIENLSGAGLDYVIDSDLLQLNNPWSARNSGPDEVIEEIEGSLVEAQHTASMLTQELSQKNLTVNSLTQELSQKNLTVNSLTQELNQKNLMVTLLYQSNSWKFTAPLRKIKNGFRRAKTGLKNTNKILPNIRIRVMNFKLYLFYKFDVLRTTLLRFNSPADFIRKVILVLKTDGLLGLVRKIQRATGLDFNEKEYLLKRPDVAESVARGDFINGLDHYLKHGIHEKHGTHGRISCSSRDYKAWVDLYGSMNEEKLNYIQAKLEKMGNGPLISIILPTFNAKPQWLSEAINSVRAQFYKNWELCIADDASTNFRIKELLETYKNEDVRIKVVYREKNGHISAASNSALELATGKWLVFLDHDDLISEDALFWIADAIIANENLCLVYSDEDKVGDTGLRFSPYFKTDWNIDLLYSHNMVCHLAAYRTELVKEIGGFREGFEGAQDYDLVLRYSEKISIDQIHHIPRVLYHWRSHVNSTSMSIAAKPYAIVAGQRALSEHLARIGAAANVENTNFGYRVNYLLPKNIPLVSLIIPTKNGLEILRACINSILNNNNYNNIEIIVVDNGSDDIECLDYFKDIVKNPIIKVIHYPGEFNYSAINNFAVESAKGEIIGLINNDIEVISGSWLSEMVSIAIQPGVGAVGAKLFYSNDTLQHGGVILGLGGVAGHSHKHASRDDVGYCLRSVLRQSLSAVTAACLIIKKSIFQEVGGLDATNLKIAFNDVDFCLRVKKAGYRNVWTPYAELYHHESISRGPEDSPEKQLRFTQEVEYMKSRWEFELNNDPAYSPNLTFDYEDFSFAWPPRI